MTDRRPAPRTPHRAGPTVWGLLAVLAAPPAPAADETARVVAVTPHWAVRALDDAGGFRRCEAEAFARDDAAALTLRLDAAGAFGLGLATGEDLMPPGARGRAMLVVTPAAGAPWTFDSGLVGEVGGVAVAGADGFALAFALARGGSIEITAAARHYAFPLGGTDAALAALADCAAFFGVPALSLPPRADAGAGGDAGP